MSVPIKGTNHYFPVVLFTMLYKVVLTFESVDEIHSVHFLNQKTIQTIETLARPY